VHYAGVFDASFSPDGDWIVTAGPRAAAIVDAATGLPLVFPLTGHDARLTSASFAPGGRSILTSSRDGTVRVYDCEVCGTVDELVAVAEARLEQTGRELTPAERELYLAD
jgi:WD40 repeat protein